MRRTFFLLTLTLVLALAVGSAWADAVTGLTTFTSGTPAIAASVNSNFAEIDDSVDDNDTRITSLQSAFAGTQYLTFGSYAFVALHGTDDYFLNEYNLRLTSGTSGTYWFYTDVHLPQGAQVTGISGYVTDSTATDNVAVILGRTNLNGSGLSSIASWGTTNADASGMYNLASTSISNGTIDNRLYTNYVRVTFSGGDQGSSLEFHSVTIEYILP